MDPRGPPITVSVPAKVPNRLVTSFRMVGDGTRASHGHDARPDVSLHHAATIRPDTRILTSKEVGDPQTSRVNTVHQHTTSHATNRHTSNPPATVPSNDRRHHNEGPLAATRHRGDSTSQAEAAAGTCY